jgi:hypothetical protein
MKIQSFSHKIEIAEIDIKIKACRRKKMEIQYFKFNQWFACERK